jgi:hypothetical protein
LHGGKVQAVDIYGKTVDICTETVDIPAKTVDIPAKTVDIPAKTVDISRKTVDIRTLIPRHRTNPKKQTDQLPLFGDSSPPKIAPTSAENLVRVQITLR